MVEYGGGGGGGGSDIVLFCLGFPCTYTQVSTLITHIHVQILQVCPVTCINFVENEMSFLLVLLLFVWGGGGGCQAHHCGTFIKKLFT